MVLKKYRGVFRKAAACLTAAALTAGLLAGCAAQGKEEGSSANVGETRDSLAAEDSSAAKGRYVEEDIEVPWDEDAQWCYGCKDADGKIQAFLYDPTSMAIMQYQYDGSWSEADCGWINEIAERGNEIYYVRYGQDGAYYVLATESQEEEQTEETDTEDYEQQPMPWHLYTRTESETQEISLPFLTAEGQESQAFFPFYMGILQNGDIAFVGTGSDDIVVYDRTSGKKKAELAKHQTMVSEDLMYLLEGNTLATLAENQTDIVFYDTQTGEEEKRISIGEQKQGSLTAGGNGDYYLANSEGIWRFRDDGSILEQIFDGSLGSMGSASQILMGFLTGEDEDFYVFYRSENLQQAQMKHYIYDAEASAIPSQTLSIYGLRENSKITEAVHVFQMKNPDVKVDYQYAFGEYDGGETEDTIKALNTELLGGQGADVLVLDGLPEDSYIEKGVLADITEFGDQLEQDGTVLEAVAEGSRKDGKLYSLATGMMVPIMYGTKETSGILESLDALEEYLEKEEDALVTGVNAYSNIAWMLFALDYENVIDENKAVQKEEVVRILEDAKKIGDNNNGEYVKMMQQEWIRNRKESQDLINRRTAFQLSGCETYYNETCVGIRAVNSIYALADICDAKKPLNMEARSINNYYIPTCVLGINAASQQKELARSFIETVLSDAVQTATDSDIPVRTESIDGLAKLVEDKDMYTMGTSGWDGEMHSYGYPTAEEIEPFLTIFKQVKKPFAADSTVQEAFLDAADRYFNDGVSKEEAAEEMAQMVDMYLAE